MRDVERNSSERWSHQSRRFTLIFAAVFMMIGTMLYMFWHQFKQDLIDDQITQNTTRTERVATRIDHWLKLRKTEINTLANTPVIRSMDWSQSGPFLKKKHASMPWIYIFAHINPDGTYYNSKVDFAEGKNLSDRAHFKASIAGDIYASDPVVSRTLGTDIVAVTSPVFRDDSDESEIVGVFGGMIDTSTIVDELSRFSNGPGSYAFATNAEGIVISHPDPERMGNINTKKFSLLNDDDAGLRAVTAEMLEGKQGWMQATIEGKNVYATYTRLSEADWYLATVTQADYMFDKVRFIDYVGVFAMVVLLLSAAVVLRYRRMEIKTVDARRLLSDERNRAKSIFLANMSHELRTPLNGIIGYGQILANNRSVKADKSLSQAVQVIRSSANHLLALINRVLDLSKIEAGQVDVFNSSVNLREFIENLELVYNVEASKYGADFSCAVSPVMPTRLWIDTEKLRQVITNPVVNAFKYGGGSDVILNIGPCNGDESRQWCIEVTDRGPGMSPEQIAGAFEAFRRYDESASDGAGLGLSIVKEMVSLLGGAVEIDSCPGNGTTVRITLPLVEPPQESMPDSRGQRGLPVEIVGARPVVLVVDDNQINLDYMDALLSSAGFDVLPCSSVDEALAALEAREINLVITDLVMPQRNGFDLIEEVRRGSGATDIPIIVSSASAFAEDRTKSLGMGADAFLPKPVDALLMLDKIADLLGLEYRYEGEGEGGTATRIAVESVLAEAMKQSDAAEAITAIRHQAGLGRISDIPDIVARVKDDEIRQGLSDLLGSAIQSHDPDLVLKILGETVSDGEGR